MLESIVWIFLLSIATFLIVVAIPYAIKNATEAESNPEHLYNIFMKEAGWRGRHVICAVGCFLPITLFFNPHVKIEGIGVALLFVAYCFYEHIKLYAGVKIFNSKISIFLLIIIFLNIAFGIAHFNNHLGSIAQLMFLVFCGLFWGFIVNLKRAKIVLHNKSLKHQSLRSLDSF